MLRNLLTAGAAVAGYAVGFHQAWSRQPPTQPGRLPPRDHYLEAVTEGATTASLVAVTTAVALRRPIVAFVGAGLLYQAAKDTSRSTGSSNTNTPKPPSEIPWPTNQEVTDALAAAARKLSEGER